MRGYLIVVGVIVFLVARYLIHCIWFPMADCWFCGGKGRHYAKRGRGRPRRRCGRCKGTGERVRTGRRVYDWVVGRRRG